MIETINYDDKSIKDFNINNVLYNKFNLTSIKFLEKPSEVIDNKQSRTLIKIICTRELKVFLKNIEKILNYNVDNADIVSISINYDIGKNKDYYELLLNKKIDVLLEDNFNLNENYNIVLSLPDRIVLWKIHSMEINDNNKLINDYLDDDDLIFENFDPDYEEVINSLKSELILKIKEINFDLERLNKNKIEFEKIFNNIDIKKLEDYRNLINSYSN
tara:strand:- start:80 stop:730 length:651 start_codon:yes stop_codon:yes gene_type:complete